MSAVTAVPSWDTPAVRTGHPELRRSGAMPGRRDHLRAVPDLPAGAGARPTAHITRRGRLLLTTLAMALCLTGGVTGARAAMGGTPAPTYDIVVVQSGQTLSQVAHRAYPRLPVDNAIQRVQSANRLNTLQVFAGERLQLPR